MHNNLEEQLRRVIEKFVADTYEAYLDEVKNPSEIVIHYLLYKFLKKCSFVDHVELERKVTVQIDEADYLQEMRTVSVDIIINQNIPIEVKLQSKENLGTWDRPTTYKKKSKSLKHVGDDRKLMYLTKNNGVGFHLCLCRTEAAFKLIKYESGSRITYE